MSNELTASQQALPDAVDRMLLRVIEEGQQVLDESGNPVVENGQVVRKEPSAAYISAAIKRIGQLGVGQMAAPGSKQQDLIDGVRRSRLRLAGGGKLPELSESCDAAVG